MSDVILALLEDPEQADNVMAAASQLATRIGGANIRTLTVPPSEAVATERIAADTDIAAAVQAQGSRADFIVVGRPEPHDDQSTRRAFRAALFETGRPVLLVPPVGLPGGLGRRVAIAWHEDSRALKTIMSATRLLANADQVQVIVGLEPGAASPSVPAVLIEHDVQAALQAVNAGDEPFGPLLLRYARQLEADLLVMGAYAHSPLQEMLLGGTTRYVLENAELPVLMCH